MHNWKDKIVFDRGELARRIEAEKAAGKKIVFTNGAFDLLHVGHVRSLVDAKEHADVLVVALNSDDSIRRNKGPHLPIHPLEERAEVLACLEYVDLVTSFNEPTVDELLLDIKPDLHAKGTDYTVETVPERETVLSYGGGVIIVGDPKDHSSTDVMEKIATAHASKTESRKHGK